MMCIFVDKFGRAATSSICDPYPDCEGCPYNKRKDDSACKQFEACIAIAQ